MTAPFIVAELSANHLGSLSRALAIVDHAAAAGADAIKLQTWMPFRMVGNPGLVIQSGPWAGRRMGELYEEASTPWRWHKPIFDRAAERGIEAFSTAFDPESVEFLEELGVKRHKIASFELVDLDLIRTAAATRKPLILSTGMATFMEIAGAFGAACRAGAGQITLLRCVSAYPAPPHAAGLRLMASMPSLFSNCPYGLSDHSPGIGVAVAAAALGASMIEKHLTLSRADGGPDAGFSLEPDEFAALVRECRAAAAATLFDTGFGPSEHEMPQLAMRRSLWWRADLKPGEVVSRGMFVTARPALGLSPHRVDSLIGRPVLRAVRSGMPVQEGDFEHQP